MERAGEQFFFHFFKNSVYVYRPFSIFLKFSLRLRTMRATLVFQIISKLHCRWIETTVLPGSYYVTDAHASYGLEFNWTEERLGTVHGTDGQLSFSFSC